MIKAVVNKGITIIFSIILTVNAVGLTLFCSFATGNSVDGNHSFYIGGTYYKSVIAEFNSDYTVLTVYPNGLKSDGIMKDWSMPDGEKNDISPACEHADTLKEVVFKNGIVNIGNYFLYECSSLERVQLPKSLKTI